MTTSTVLATKTAAVHTGEAGSSGMTGEAVPYAQPRSYLAVVATAVGLAVVTARLTRRLHPVEALGTRE
ncbi:hypothetical protein ACIBG7_26345 [Nonomuraea sp. NPDC050328]|uniref:hypothetical protein n=1 Tax=Nonomuraea sp. NPDC050328 TaxID=3364361 RepID=UPI0037B9DCAF